MPGGVELTVQRRGSGAAALGPRGGLQLRAVVAGLICTFAVSLILAAVLALVVNLSALRESVASQILYYGGLASLVAGAGFGARRASGLGWLHGVAIGVAYVLASVLIGAFVFPGGPGPNDLGGRLLLGGAAGLLGGVLGVAL